MLVTRALPFVLLGLFLSLNVPAARAGGCGDVDGDGVVGSADALLVLRAAVGEDAALACQQQTSADLEERVAALETLLSHFTIEGDTLVLSGMNFQIVNGLGATDGKEGPGSAVNGLGNLIIGYDEEPTEPSGDVRQGVEKNGQFGFEKPKGHGGSHNLIVGAGHAYTSYGGIVAGEENAIGAPGASVLGGFDNTADELHASVLGGSHNVADGEESIVAGGTFNRAFTLDSAASGGIGNFSLGFASVVSGGEFNRAYGPRSVIAGGSGNIAYGTSTAISGGSMNQTDGFAVVVGGGRACSLTGTSRWRAGDLMDGE